MDISRIVHATPSRLLFALLLISASAITVSLTVAGDVVAQETPTTTSDEDEETTTENSSVTTTESHFIGVGNGTNVSTGAGGNAGGGGGGLFGGWGVPDIPGPWEWSKGVIEGAVDSLVEGVESLINLFNDMLHGIPAPGNWRHIGSWFNPQNGNWQGVWNMYWLNVGIAFPMLVIAALWSWSNESEREWRQMQKRVVYAGFHMLLGWFYLGALLHLGNGMSIGFAPSGSEMLSTPGNIAKLSLGVIVGAVLVIFKSGAVAAGVLVVISFYFIILFLVAFWPWFIFFRALDAPGAPMFGELGVSALPLIVVLRIFQSAILRFLSLIEWNFSDGGALVMSVFGTGLGLYIAYLGLPYVGYKKVLPGSMRLTQPVKTKGDDLAQKNRQEVQDKAQQQYENARGKFSSIVSKSPSESRSGSGSPSSNTSNDGPALGERPLPSENADGTTVWTDTNSDGATSQPSSSQPSRKRPATDGGTSDRINYLRRVEAKDILSDYENRDKQ